MKFNARFDFLEQRPYVHSTQLVYELIKILKDNKYINNNSDIQKISCIYKLLCNKQGFYIIDEEYNGEYSTLFNIKINNKDITAYYVENNEPVVNRIPYDEDNIINNYQVNLDEKNATVEIYRDDNIYNVIVALSKKLLTSVFDSNGFASWKVGKFTASWSKMHNNPVGKTLKMSIKHSIDDQYIHSKLYIDDELVGSMDNAREKK